MVSSAFVVVVKNHSTEDTIIAATSSGWNIAKLGASRCEIWPDQEHRFYRKNGKAFRLTIILPDGTEITLDKIKKPCQVEVTCDNGKWISKRNPLEIESSEHQKLLREERAFHLFKRNWNYYEILGVPKDATDEQIKKALDMLLQDYQPANSGKKNHFSCGAMLYIALLDGAHDTLLDPEKRSKYDKELRSPGLCTRRYWTNRWDNWKALPWYWKWLLPGATLLGIGATIAAATVTCGGAIPVILSVIAGCGLGGGFSSAWFSTSNEAADMKPDQRNKGIWSRLLLGGILGGAGGFITAWFGPMITAACESLMAHALASAINSAACIWIDSFLMSLANFIAEGIDDAKKWCLKKCFLEVGVFPLIGALLGFGCGAVCHCTQTAIDEAIGALIANKSLSGFVKFCLKQAGKLPAMIIDKVKHLWKLLKLLTDSD